MLIQLYVAKFLKIVLIALFFLGGGIVSSVYAGEICFGIIRVDVVTLTCSVNYGSPVTGYCRTSHTDSDDLPCNNPYCSTISHPKYYTFCGDAVGNYVQRDGLCYGNLPYSQPYGYVTSQCYVYCDENDWSACSESCGGGTQTNDCGDTRACNTQPCCSPVDGGWSAWGACGASCTQTRTCTNPEPYCGGADCVGDSTQACAGGSCTATLTGTIFDASDLSSCPADIGTNPIYAPIRFGGADFDITSTTPTSQAVTTNANGVYTLAVYPDVLPKNYSYDYTDFLATGLVSSVKFECQSAVATVTTAETVTKDTGFWRQYGGWWQTVGGNVYARSGIASSIPSSVVPVGNQKLILADGNGRTGVLSYGVSWDGDELGTNPNAAVSSSLWRVESLYEGVRYDYDFYKTRMAIFASTVWDGGAIAYNDGGLGYQIFKHTGDVDLDYVGPTGSEKVILLVDGDVNVISDITVPTGAFLGVIASGDIIFDSDVTNAEGWFVGENISVPCADTAVPIGTCDRIDVQFAGEGSFVGWSGVDLNRDMGAGNNASPAELFTYRADLLINAPMPMKVYTRKYSPFIP